MNACAISVTVNACAISITYGATATRCDIAAIRYCVIWNICLNQLIVCVSPLLYNTILTACCYKWKEWHHVVITVVSGVASSRRNICWKESWITTCAYISLHPTFQNSVHIAVMKIEHGVIYSCRRYIHLSSHPVVNIIVHVVGVLWIFRANTHHC